MIKVILLILVAELWGIGGQILYKKSVNKLETPNLRCIRSYSKFLISILKTPRIWLGVACISVGLAVWLAALAQTNLSIAFPIDSMQYIITLVAAHFFLGEKINKFKLLGTLLIVGGIVLVAIS